MDQTISTQNRVQETSIINMKENLYRLNTKAFVGAKKSKTELILSLSKSGFEHFIIFLYVPQ